MKKHAPIAIPILALFAALIILFASGLGNNPQTLPSITTGRQLPAFDLPALDDSRRYTNTDLPQGTPFLINIWGSWCSACREEHSYLIELSAQIPIIGLNWPADNKSEAEDAATMLARGGNPYRSNIRDPDGTFITDLGVYGAPETYLIGHDGTIRYRHAGPLNPQVWTTHFQPLLD